MRYGRTTLGVAVLLAAGAGLTCVRPPPPGDPTVAAPSASGGTFVAGSFQKLMTVGRHIETAEEGETRLFVGRFDHGGVDGWLRSFPGASDSVAMAYLQNPQGIVVVGAFARGINFDRPDQRLATSRQAGLFFTRFAATGRTLVATKIAEAGGFRAPTLVAAGGGYRVTVPFRGGASVPGQQPPPQEAGILDLYLDANGRPQRAGFTPEGRLLQPGTTDPGDVRPGAPRGGLIHDDGQRAQHQLAFLMQAAECDYCAPNNGPWSGSPCASCRDKVFRAMPWCRDTAWTIDCMVKASSVCGGSTGVRDVCYCAHATGQVREAMPSFCSSPPAAPPNRAPVVNRVCGVDGFCCTFEPAGTYYPGWDDQCRVHGLSFDASGP